MTNEELAKKIRETGDRDALEHLFRRNLPLIRKWLYGYSNYVDIADLEQEAFLGLWDAAMRFESDREVKFATYAEYWVKLYARRFAMENVSIVSIPAHIRQKISEYKKAVSRLEQELSREPSDSELADFLLMDSGSVARLRTLAKSAVSLDAPISNEIDTETPLMDCLPGPDDTEAAAVDFAFEDSKSEIWAILEKSSTLNEKENAAVKLRFRQGMRLSDVAAELDGSVEYARTLTNAALRKIRRSKLRSRLAEKYEIAETRAYDSGLRQFERSWASSTEAVALRRLEALEQISRAARNLV